LNSWSKRRRHDESFCKTAKMLTPSKSTSGEEQVLFTENEISKNTGKNLIDDMALPPRPPKHTTIPGGNFIQQLRGLVRYAGSIKSAHEDHSAKSLSWSKTVNGMETFTVNHI